MIARNLQSAMSAYSRSTEAGEVARFPGLVLVSSGIDYAVFNSAVFADAADHETIVRLAGEAREFYVHRKIGWSCWFCPELLDDGSCPRLSQLLERWGLQCVAEHQCMMSDRVTPAARPLPALNVREVQDPQSRLDFIHVCVRTFGLPAAIARQIYGSERFWRGALRGWVGYAGGWPVTTAATEAAEGSIGVYSVATLPEFRRRGYGEAITRHSIREATTACGLECSTLQSTPAGLTLYRGMGYKPCGRFLVFATP